MHSCVDFVIAGVVLWAIGSCQEVISTPNLGVIPATAGTQNGGKRTSGAEYRPAEAPNTGILGYDELRDWNRV